jgi:carbon storage regulator
LINVKPNSTEIEFRKELQMLVLSRERNERIYVGNDIIITIADVRGDKVRIGIDAPAELRIIREELVAEMGKTTPEKSTCSQQLVKAYRQSREGAEDHRLVNTISAAAQIILNLATGLHDNEDDSWALVEELIRQYAAAKKG